MQKTAFDPNNKVLMSRNEKVMSEEQGTYTGFARLLTNVLKAFQALEIGDLSYNDLTRLIVSHTAEEFVRDHMLKGRKLAIDALPGIKLSLEALKDMIEIPDLSAVKEAIEQYRYRARYNMQVRLNEFSIVDGEVKANQSILDAIECRCSRYADCPQELEVFTLLSEAVERLQVLRTKYGIYEFENYWDVENGKVTIKASVIQRRIKNVPYYQPV